MREIKFRFIFKSGGFFAKRYMTLDELLDIDFALESMEEWVNEELGIDNVEDYPEYEVFKSQYTGIKDRKGKEIYEGDILKVGENLVCEIVYISDNIKDYGDEINSAFHAKLFYHDKLIPLDNYLKEESEVIGNIYETPDLIP